MARSFRVFLSATLCGVLVGCDHATKHAAVSLLAPEPERPVVIVPGIFDLRYTENRDIAFSLLSSWAGSSKWLVLTALSLLVLAFVMLVWWRRRNAPVAEQVAFTLIVAGALGNVIDRAMRGYVVDFMHLHHWPVFNVADVVIVLGIAMLMLAGRTPMLRRRIG